MKRLHRGIVPAIAFLTCLTASAQKIERFEHLKTSDGLSQNNVLSMLCDSKGYMWFGTMNGLNRYNGYEFQIYKVEEEKENSLTHNRIVEIWEDKRNVIWVKTYDGYIHYFVPETEEFITFPYYQKSTEEKNSVISYFEQASDDEIWLGSTNSGAYHLKFDAETGRYDVRQYLSRGSSSISNNSVSFILSDDNGDVWVGTAQGLNRLGRTEMNSAQPAISHSFADATFTSAAETPRKLYFGSEAKGVVRYDIAGQRFERSPGDLKVLDGRSVALLQKLSDGRLAAGTRRSGLFLFDENDRLEDHILEGRRINRVYEDRFENLWINTEEFGVYRYRPVDKFLKKYQLSEPDETLTDEERQFIYEDSQDHLWIGLHGCLAYYNRELDEFEFYRNDPKNPESISSNIVYCITEDASGLLWVGTGQPNGGVDKIITANPSFKHFTLAKNATNNSQNVVRALFQDSNGYAWAATKSGRVYIMAPENLSAEGFSTAAFETVFSPGQNIYSIMQDTDGYIWLGSKGKGVFKTTRPAGTPGFYKNLSFVNYRHDSRDSLSLSSDNIYSIIQDRLGRIWIGAYGGGLNLVTGEVNGRLRCRRFTTANSSLSSDDIRMVYEDSRRRLWAATAFGLNLIEENGDDFEFRRFFYNPDDPASISYNDIIHIFEDSRNRLWFTTFGGGVNQLVDIIAGRAVFKRWSQDDGLVNDAVFSVLEDREGFLWFSAERGVSRFDPEKEIFENFDRNNGLPNENFSENTGCATSGGSLLFGNTGGILLIAPDKLTKSTFAPNIVLTNFQIFNRDVDFADPDAPIRQHIETLNEITLRHNQSSFSFEYAALSFFAPTKNQYAFMLENFDETWNEVGAQRKATYTNLPPGDYVFKVKAASWDGVWNDQPRSIAISILKPWWQTNAAYLAYFIIAAFMFEVVRRSWARYHRLQNDLKVEKRVSEIKLKFFTNISHEIRTPLTLILGPIDDIKSIPNLPKEVRDRMDIMERNGKRMLRLVNQLLDFRKVQKNKMRLTVQEIELNTFLQDILQNFNHLAARKRIAMHYDSDDRQIPVWVDAKKFDSVIFNILSNALKYTAAGKNIYVTVNSRFEDHIEISVRDEGKGISKENKRLLFQRFTALSSDQEEINNSGIGLSLANEIVKLHKGSIDVASDPGKGSCFSIHLQKGYGHFSNEKTDILATPDKEIVHQEAPAPEEPAAIASAVGANGARHKALIVEDNPEIVAYVSKSLCQRFEIAAAGNGREALEKLQSYHPDLIITDVMMPEMDGIEMTRRVKENIELSHIPVVMLTARSTIEDQIVGVESGAEAYILKPFNAQYLLAVATNLLEQREKLYTKYLTDNGRKTYKDPEPGDISITSKDEQFLDDVMKLIEENYADPDFNVEKLVESSYVSRTVFYNKIKGLTGLSPSEFLRNMRIKIAGRLLLETSHNVSEVAYETGFNNVKYFRQHFKSVFGMTPNDYKNKNRALDQSA